MKKQAGLLIVLLLLIACQNKDTAGESGTQATGNTLNPTVDNFETPSETELQFAEQITIQFAISEGERLYYEPLVESFEADNPDIQIRLVSIGEIRAAAGETPASVALAEAADVFPSRFTNFGPNRASVTRDLTPFIQADPAFNPENFYTDTQQEVDGSIRVLPISVDVQLIYYDKDAFDATELAYPQMDWTWESFRTMVNALTIHEGEEVSQWGFVEPNARYFVEGQLDNSLVTAAAARFTDDDVVAAVRWYTDLFLADQVAPLPTSDDAQMRLTQTPYFASEEARQLISVGRVAMWSDSSTALAFVGEERNVGVVPYPVSAAIADSSPIHIDGLVMSAGTIQPGSAWRWMDFLSRQNPADFGSNVLLPARVSVATASGFWNSIDPTLADALRFALEHQRPFLRSPIFNAFNQAINEILTDNQSVEAALANAQLSNISEDDAQTDLVEPIAPPSPDESNVADSITIQFVTQTRAGAQVLAAFQVLARQFESQNPNIQIDLLPSNEAASEVGRDFVITAENSHCFQLYSTEAFFDPAEQAAILSLTPFVEVDPAFDLTDFYTPLLNEYRFQGQLWALPAEYYPILIEYNKDLFDVANVPYPSPHWTIEDFRNTAEALTQEDASGVQQYGFIAESFEASVLLPILAQAGAVLIDENSSPPTLLMTAPATIEAMRWYASLSTNHNAKPIFLADPSDWRRGDIERLETRNDLIASGQASMWTLYEPATFSTQQWPELNTVYAPLPMGTNVTDPGPLLTTAYFISANSTHEQAQTCWEWLKFLTESTQIGQWLPARRSVAESPSYRRRVGEPFAEALVNGIAHIEGIGVADKSHSNVSWMFPYGTYWLSRAYSQITVNGVLVEDALNSAQQTFNSYRACVSEQDAFTNREAQIQCALEIDPSLTTILSS